jgi:putative FmdB family regulatory protein
VKSSTHTIVLVLMVDSGSGSEIDGDPDSELYYSVKLFMGGCLKMPIYEYACEECDKQFEIMQKITDEPLTACPDCKGRVRKKISNTSFVLKGTGWYATDYSSKKDSVEKAPAEKECKTGNGKESATPAPETTSKPKEPAASST